MQVSFEGICLWDRQTRAPRVLGIMRNASANDVIGGIPIPAHTACIIVRTDSVDGSLWNELPVSINFRGQPHSLYQLHGDEISFDPAPAGGAPNVTSLPKADCAAARVLDPALTAATPSATAVAARIELPETANLIVVRNIHGAQLTLLTAGDGTSLVAQRFDGVVRRLSFTGTDPHVIVANVDLPLALSDPVTVLDDDHGVLYCPMFIDAPNPPPFALRGDVGGNLLFSADVGDLPRRPDSVRAVRSQRRPAPRRDLGDFLTLGAGCSNSQYP